MQVKELFDIPSSGKENDMKSNVSNLVRDALMLGVLICLSQISVALPTAVPITLQTLAIYLIACLMTPNHAFYTVLCYLIMGAIGLPVFSHFSSGMGALIGPTGGFLFSFPIMALVMSIIITHDRSAKGHILAMIIGTAITYGFGSIYFMYTMKAALLSTLMTCVLPFLLGDALKIAVSCMIAFKLEKIVLKKTVLS